MWFPGCDQAVVYKVNLCYSKKYINALDEAPNEGWSNAYTNQIKPQQSECHTSLEHTNTHTHIVWSRNANANSIEHIKCLHTDICWMRFSTNGFG